MGALIGLRTDPRLHGQGDWDLLYSTDEDVAIVPDAIGQRYADVFKVSWLATPQTGMNVGYSMPPVYVGDKRQLGFFARVYEAPLGSQAYATSLWIAAGWPSPGPDVGDPLWYHVALDTRESWVRPVHLMIRDWPSVWAGGMFRAGFGTERTGGLRCKLWLTGKG